MSTSQPRWLIPSAIAILAVFNALLIRDLFGIVYPASMYSIEAAYVSLARAYQEHGFQMLWFPYWYGGLPMVNTYAPLLHLIVAGCATLSGLSVAHSYHVVTAITYSLIPAAVVFLVWVFSRRPYAAIVAGLLVSLFAPSTLLLQEARQSVGGIAYPRRLQALFTFGEGPHVTSILWLLLALAAVHLAMEKRRAGWFALAALLLGATVLTNTIGAFALLLLVLAYLGARHDAFQPALWLRAAALGLITYLLIAPLFPPTAILAIRANAPFVGGVFQGTPLSYGLLLAHVLLGFAVASFLRGFGVELLARLAVAASISLGGVTLSRGLYGIPLLPQPERYHLVFEIALILAVVALFAPLLERYQSRRVVIAAGVTMLLVFAVVQLRNTRYWIRQNVKGGDASQTVEYQSARWFAENLSGQRVFVPGSISFWLYAFADQPQLGGGFDNGVANLNYLALSYQILSGDGAGDREAEIAVTWLKALGVRAVQVSYPDSPEVFHPYRNPAKFEGVLAEIWRHRGTTTYEIPVRHPGLAFVVGEQQVPRHRPVNGLDVGEAERYVAEIDNLSLPESRWKWAGPNEAHIHASLGEAHVLSVQVAYHPGWEAWSGDQPLPVEGDGLGQIVLRPGPGTHNIRLVFTGGLEALLTRIASASALFALLVAFWWERRRRPS